MLGDKAGPISPPNALGMPGRINGDKGISQQLSRRRWFEETNGDQTPTKKHICGLAVYRQLA
jgi:hypothetical protein